MFVTRILMVFILCVSLPQVRSVQLRLVNANNGNRGGDTSTAGPGLYQSSAPGSYSYNYGIADHNTGDHKTQWEKKENGVVQGSYSVLEPDGSTRVVEYTADNTGFHPVIKKIDTPIAASANVVPTYTVSTPRPIYASNVNTNRAYAISTDVPTPYNAYTPTSLLYNNQYNPNSFPGYYNYDNERLYYPSNTYRTPIVNNGYNNAYYNRGRYAGYDGTYAGYNSDVNTLGATPYNQPLRPQKQAVPLLHSAYHGYDNLYH